VRHRKIETDHLFVCSSAYYQLHPFQGHLAPQFRLKDVLGGVQVDTAVPALSQHPVGLVCWVILLHATQSELWSRGEGMRMEKFDRDGQVYLEGERVEGW